MANVPRTGLARQAEYGTAVTDFTPVKLNDIGSTELTINKIENDELFGGLDTFAPENGLREAAISFGGRSYSGAIGYFLNMIAGDPVTTGTAPNFTHTFVPSDTLPPAYTIGMAEPNGHDAYFRDVRASSLTLSQEEGDVLTFSIDGIASDRVMTPITVENTGLENRAFRYSDFTAFVKVGVGTSAQYLNFKSLSITIENPVSNIFTLNGEDTAITQEFTGRRGVTFDATLRFEAGDEQFLDAYEDNLPVELILEWAIDTNTSLMLTVPNARILTHDWTRGFDETVEEVSGAAYFDSDLDGSIELVLKNQTESYDVVVAPPGEGEGGT